MSSSVKQFAGAAQRNMEPIKDRLRDILNVFGDYKNLKLLEIASGTGQHCVHFAAAFPNIRYQPSEYSQSSIPSIAAYVEEANLPNLLPPLQIDISKDPAQWLEGPLGNKDLDVMLCINMIHITPWSCTEALFSAAGSVLKKGGLLVTYGPIAKDGVIEPQSNINFDLSLKARDSSWGIRDSRALGAEAIKNGLRPSGFYPMPANNTMLVFHRV